MNGARAVEIRRAGDRFVTRDGGVVSRHSFSFGPHYDPGNVGFGLLVMSNDDVIAPGAGYPTHPHRDVEIVTWVLEGALAHRDSTGEGGVIRPGLVQRISAGRGVRHSEFNAASERGAPLRFVQIWVPPDVAGAEPSYQQSAVDDELAGGGLVVVASGLRRHVGSAIGLGQRAAAMHVARPVAGSSLTLPNAPFVHLYVARGEVDVEAVESVGDDVEGVRFAGDVEGVSAGLVEGDAVRVTDEGGRTVRATADAELIVWEMHATASAP